MPRVAFYRNRGDIVPRASDATWDEMAGFLGADAAREGPCTLGNCRGHDCPNKDTAPSGLAAWSPVRIASGGTRANRPCFLHHSVTTRRGHCDGECPRGESAK